MKQDTDRRSIISSSLNIICLETEAFYALVEDVLGRVQSNQDQDDPWIDEAEAMRLLRIKSKTTLQKLRDEGAIRFSHPTKKLILYYKQSLYDYLEKHAREVL